MREEGRRREERKRRERTKEEEFLHLVEIAGSREFDPLGGLFCVHLAQLADRPLQ
jgi:hypothetical protein